MKEKLNKTNIVALPELTSKLEETDDKYQMRKVEGEYQGWGKSVAVLNIKEGITEKMTFSCRLEV